MNKISLLIALILLSIIIIGCKPSSQSPVETIDDDLVEEHELIYRARDDFEIKTISENKNDIGYAFYSYGGDVDVKIKGEVIDLTDAINNNLISVEDILIKARKDSEEGIIEGDVILDGGSQIYLYPTYTIIKCDNLDGVKDLYIGNVEMFIDDVLDD